MEFVLYNVRWGFRLIHSQKSKINIITKYHFTLKSLGKIIKNLNTIPDGYEGKITSKVTRGSTHFYNPLESKIAVSLRIKSTYTVKPSNSTSWDQPIAVKTSVH